MSGTENTGSALAEDDSNGTEWRAIVGRLVIAAVVLAVVYVGVALYFKDRSPAGATVDGIEVGGLNPDEATAYLEKRIGPRLEEPIQVRLALDQERNEVLELIPVEAGLGFDYQETLQGVAGSSFNPGVLWAHLTGGTRDLELVGTIDRAALEKSVRELAADYDTEPVNGEVQFTQDGVQLTDSAPGQELDVAGTAEAVAQGWPSGTEVEGAAASLDPELSNEELERFVEAEAEPALSAPIKVTATRGKGDSAKKATAEITPRELAGVLEAERADGEDEATLTLALDEEALLKRIRQDLGRLERGPRDATVKLSGNDVRVVKSRNGAALVTDDLAEQVQNALSETGSDRTVKAELERVEPEISTSASDSWSFEEMSSFTSTFPTGAANAERTANLHNGINHLNGIVVMPGEQFSLGQGLGEITQANGYVEAPVIVDGKLVDGIGGGLSQVSTVVFNASWSAGVQLDAHSPHSYYIPRYPAGREATLAYPTIDNLWTNDTKNPIVVRAWISGDQITMKFLGKRQYTVQTVDGSRHNFTSGQRRTDNSPDCIPQGAAQGFTINNTRILKRGGAEVSRDEFTTVYQPADEIVCTG